jgi:ERF superfamily
MSELTITNQDAALVAHQVANPMSMIATALEKGASVETLEKLMNLQERWETNQSRKAFIAEMALARPKFLPILKKNNGYNSRYKYESLSDVMDAVDGPLGDHGFSYDWITEDIEGGRIRVTCVVTHEDGFSRKNSLSGHPDDTADSKANMNAHQRMGGAVTYLQRYTLKAALGVAASLDTDGSSRDKMNEGSATVTPDEFIFIRNLIEELGAIEEKVLASVAATSLETMTQKQYREAISKLQSWAKKKVTTNGTA